MSKRIFVVLALILGLTIPGLAQTPGQAPATPLDKQAAKIKSKVEDMGVGHRITVKMKNGDDYHGAVSQIDPQSFGVAEVDLRQTVKFDYSEVKKVRGDYGPRNIYGNRINPNTQKIVAFSVLGGLMALMLVVAANTR